MLYVLQVLQYVTRCPRCDKVLWGSYRGVTLSYKDAPKVSRVLQRCYGSVTKVFDAHHHQIDVGSNHKYS
jgi:ribosomal protein L34E